MKELIHSLIDAAKERVKNPFLGSFILFWIIYNWKPLVYLLSSKSSIEVKIDLIAKNYSICAYYFWFPLLTALGYILAVPYISWFFDYLTTKANIGRKKAKNLLKIVDVENNQALAKENSKLEHIKAEFRDLTDFNNRIEILTRQLEERNDLIEKLKVELQTLKVKNLNIKDSESYSEDVVYDRNNLEYSKSFIEFQKSELYPYFKELGLAISSYRPLSPNFDEFILQKFKFSGIIAESGDTEPGYKFTFTAKGRFFWKEFVLITKKNDHIDLKDLI